MRYFFRKPDEKISKAQRQKHHAESGPNASGVIGAVDGFFLKEVADEILRPNKSLRAFIGDRPSRVKVGGDQEKRYWNGNANEDGVFLDHDFFWIPAINIVVADILRRKEIDLINNRSNPLTRETWFTFGGNGK